MRAREWEEATVVLRDIQAPRSPGLGQSTVDYCLGLSLSRSGPRYNKSASDAFRRAAELGGRLLSDNGPQIKPRALARIAELDPQ